jgi:hypothetical protein
MKSAVIIVHGIGPIDRYQIQDQFAAELRDALNTETDEERQQRFGGTPPKRQGQWHADVIWPPVQRNEELEGVRPSAVRVHCDNHGTDVQQEPLIDVFEGYWSPVDKGQVNAFGVLSWLVRSIFSPIANTRIAAPGVKTTYDIAFIAVVALLVPVLAYISISAAYHSYQWFTQGPFPAWKALLVGLAGGYLVAQGLSRLVPLLFAPHAGRSVRRPTMLVILGLAVVAITTWAAGGEFFDMFGRLGLLLLTTTSARLLLSLMIDFLDNRVGDIQVFATHNENQRFYGLRESMLDIVGDTVLSVLRTKEGVFAKPLYDRIYLIGHSLGSSVLMDVIIELHRLLMEGGLDDASWNRMRCFISYGSALEKTHYLLSCARPIAPQQVGEFKADLYARLFDADPAAMRAAEAGSRPPMFWMNYWYFSDVVANAIASYGHARSITDPEPEPGAHYTCLNVQLPSPSGVVWSHGYYLNDRTIWHSQGVRRGLATIVAAS